MSCTCEYYFLHFLQWWLTRGLVDKILSALLNHVYGSSYDWNCFGPKFPHFCNLNFKIFLFRKALELFEKIYLSAGNATSIMIHVFSSKFFIVTSIRFAFIFLSVLIVKSHKIVTFALPVTGCGVCSYHFFVSGRLTFLHNIQRMKVVTGS